MVALSGGPRPRALRRRRAARNHARLIAEATARPCRTHDDARVVQARHASSPTPRRRNPHHLDRSRDARRVVDRDPAARCAPARASPAWFPIRSTYIAIIACIARAPSVRWKAACMAKTTEPTESPEPTAKRRPRARRACRSRSRPSIDAAHDKKADRHGRARSAQGGRVHGFLRDLLGGQSAAGAGHCRCGGRGAQGAEAASVARRRLRPRGVGAARLLRLRGARLLEARARFLRPRSALGQRHPHRISTKTSWGNPPGLSA